MTGQPVLAVDIDGVLNALGMDMPWPGWNDVLVLRSDGPVEPYLFRLRFHQGHGVKLLAVAHETGAELVWCTRWERMANDLMRHLLGLPALPWVPMQASKAAALREWADGRPFCWLDDEPEEDALDGYPAPCTVVVVDGLHGLQDTHLSLARSWLAGLREPETIGA